MVSGRTAMGFLIVALFALLPAFAKSGELTRRSRNDVREGPGSYYPLVCVLPSDTPVEILSRQGGWSRIRPENPSLLPEQNDLRPGSISRDDSDFICFFHTQFPLIDKFHLVSVIKKPPIHIH